MLQNTVTEKEEEEALIYHPTFLVGCNCVKERPPVRVGAAEFGMERIVCRQHGASVAGEMTP